MDAMQVVRVAFLLCALEQLASQRSVYDGVMLHEFVTVNREEIITRCRAKVATRSDPPSTAVEVDHGVPLFLDQLLDELRHEHSTNADIAQTATEHEIG